MNDDQSARHGFFFALSAYVFWGVAPIYFKWLTHVPPLEILAHRVVWSLVLILGLLYLTGNLHTLKVSRGVLARLTITTILLACNWLIFIYGVVNDRIAETSLGYFINPLVNVFLGMLFLGERLRPLQWIAVALAATGIGYQLVVHGSLPWIALTLAFSFGFYGLLRKNLSMASATGLALETLIALPIALGGLLWFSATGQLQFGTLSWQTDVLLILAGFVTSFPLLCFAAAVTRLSLTVIGMIQYIAPSLSLLLAVVVYGEPFTPDRAVTFGFIWLALIVFTAEAVHFQRRLRVRQVAGV